jgi:MraZ protein
LIFAGALDRFHIWEPDRFAAFDAVMEGQLRESQDALDAPFQAALAAGALKLDGEGMA